MTLPDCPLSDDSDLSSLASRSPPCPSSPVVTLTSTGLPARRTTTQRTKHNPSIQSYFSAEAAEESRRQKQVEKEKEKDARKENAVSATRRPRPPPQPRITRHLDVNALGGSAMGDDGKCEKEALDMLLKTLRKKKKIVVVVGAGISVSAGIPDFRSSCGLFNTLRKNHKLKSSGKDLFDASVYSDSNMTSSFHDMVRSLSNIATEAQPTLFHQLLARLSKEGRLLRLYTQNVDGIESSLPPLATEVPLDVKAPWPRTIQLHGGLEKMVCHKCQHTSNFQPDLFEGSVPPECARCLEVDNLRMECGQRSRGVGRLRPRIVLYNESNPDEEAIGSVVTSDLRARPDALIVVGTSMRIPGVKRIVKEMSRVVRDRRDGATVWINRDGGPVGKEFGNCFDLVVKGDCDEVARKAALKMWWEEEEDNDGVEENEKSKKGVGKKKDCGQPTRTLARSASTSTSASSSSSASAAAAAAEASRFSVVVRGNQSIKTTSTASTATAAPITKTRKKPAAKATTAKANSKANVDLKSQFRVGKMSNGTAAAPAPVKKTAS